jgi:hypothetical protein
MLPPPVILLVEPLASCSLLYLFAFFALSAALANAFLVDSEAVLGS